MFANDWSVYKKIKGTVERIAFSYIRPYPVVSRMTKDDIKKSEEALLERKRFYWQQNPSAMKAFYTEQAPEIYEYFAAYEKFKQLELETGPEKSAPQLSDSKTFRIINTLSDKRIFSKLHNTLDELPVITQICSSASRVTNSYIFYGTDQASKITTENIKIIDKNTLKYQSEIAKSLSFSVNCIGFQVPIVSKFINSLPVNEISNSRIDGIHQIRDGSLNLLIGSLKIASDKTISISNRLQILEAISNNASFFAEALSARQKKSLVKMVDAMKKQPPKILHNYLDKINSEMNSTPCSSLCRF